MLYKKEKYGEEKEKKKEKEKRVRRRIIQLLAFFFRELDMKKRSYAWQLVWLVYDLMWALSVGFLGMGVKSVTSVNIDTQSYVLYLLVGSFIWTYLSSLFYIVSWSITWERWEGTIEYTFMAPVKRIIQLVGNSIFAILYGLVRMIIVFVLASVVFNISLANVNFVSAGVILVLASISFIGFGMIAAILPLISPEFGDKTVIMIEAVIMTVSGIFYPISVLPVFVQYISKVIPATYALEGIRQAVIKGADLISLWPQIWPLLVLGVVLIPLGDFMFRLAERHAKKTGKLKRNG